MVGLTIGVQTAMPMAVGSACNGGHIIGDGPGCPTVPPELNDEMVSRGIYLDFEMGMEKEIPQIAGVLVDGEYTCYVTDPLLEEAAESRAGRPGENWRFREAEDLVRWILDKAEGEGRRIMGYSTYDRSIMVRLAGDEEARIESLYYNANMAKWFRKRRKSTYNKILRAIKKDRKRRRKKVGLKDILMLDFIHYDYPRYLKSYSPGRALREMLGFLEERGEHARVPQSVKTRFTKLHRYNMHDCKGMKHLLEYRLSRGE